MNMEANGVLQGEGLEVQEIVNYVGKASEFVPSFDNVLIRIIKDEETKGGVILPEGCASLGVPRGEVIAVGPGRTELGTFVPTKVKVGQEVVVIFNEVHPPVIIPFEGVPHAVIHERDIIGVIEKEEGDTVARVS